MTSSLFAYGTLTDPQRVRSLIGRVPPTVKARLRHYERRSVPGLPYYMVAPKSGATTSGVILLGLTSRDLSIFDEYEDIDKKMYERVLVTVDTEANENMLAYVYRAGINAPILSAVEPGQTGRSL